MSPLRAWNRFWFGPISARPLAVFRIIFGLAVLAHLGFISVDLDYWYTDAGLLQGDQARLAGLPMRYSPLQYIQDPVSVRCAVAMIGAVAVGFVVGWHTRVMGVLLYLGVLSLYHRNISTNCGPDQLMTILSFYMMLAPCGAAYSLDSRRAARQRGTLAEPLIIPWAQRLIQIQLCLIYLSSAVMKCHGSTWLSGTAIHFVIFNHEVGQANLEWLAGYPVGDQPDDVFRAFHGVYTGLSALVSPDQEVDRIARSHAPSGNRTAGERASFRRADDGRLPPVPRPR